MRVELLAFIEDMNDIVVLSTHITLRAATGFDLTQGASRQTLRTPQTVDRDGDSA